MGERGIPGLSFIQDQLAQFAENGQLRKAEVREESRVKKLADGLWQNYISGDISAADVNEKLFEYHKAGVSHGALTDRLYNRMLEWMTSGD